MKKFTLVLLSLLTLLPLGAWAEVKTHFVAGVTYTYDTNNPAAQVNMVDPGVSSVEILAEITVQIGGEDHIFKVTSFNSSALRNCTSLKSLTIGENIASIPDDLFEDCSALLTLTIKKTSMLSNLSINFTRSSLNTELCIISGGIQYFHHGAWNDSKSYFSVGNGSRGYGYDAVTRNGNELTVLEKVCNIPVTTIADNAFYNTASGCSIFIPKSITTISSLSFVANKLTRFRVAIDNAKYKAPDDGDGVLFDKEAYQTLISFPTQKSNTYSIPEGVVTIGAEAFNNHVNLRSVTIPTTVKTISQSAFQYAGKNTTLSVTFNEGQLTTIERSAFQESGVTAISLPSGVKTIAGSTFYNCANLQSVSLPSSLTSIGDAAFAQCKNLVTLNFPNTLESNLTIGANAFYECKLSTNITLPEKVTTIGSDAFNCSTDLYRKDGFKLQNLYLPKTASFSSAITYSSVKVHRKVDIAFEGNYATYFSTMDLDVQSGLTAYTITEVAGTDLTLTKLPYIPKGKAVLLEKKDGVTLSEYYSMPSNETMEKGKSITYNTDLFRGSYNPIKLDNISGDKYILSGGKFVKILQGSLPAFRCYLVVNNAEIDAPADYYTFNKDDGNSYVYKEDDAYIKKNVNIGSASLSAPANNKITLTVTPKKGFYATENDITVTRNVKAVAGRAPSIDNSTIALTPAVDNADPSGVTTYTFEHVANTTYEVIVNFRKQNNFSDNNIARDIVFDATEFVYDGTAKTLTGIAVKYNNNVVNSKNYTISYTNNVNAGSATITVTGKREFVNTYSKTFNIAQREISNVTVNAIANQTFTGSEIRPEVTVTDVVNGKNILSSSEYDVDYSNNTHAGTAKVTLKAKNLNYKGNKDVNFTINKKVLTNVTYTPIPSQSYTGNEIKPSPEIKDGDVIIPSSNYDLAWENNTAVGTSAKIKVTFKENVDYTYTNGTPDNTADDIIEIPFEITSQTLTRTLNVAFEGDNKWATYFWYENLKKPEGLNVYAVTGHSGTTLTLQELDMIPAGVPVLLKRTGTTMSGFTAETTTTGSEITTDEIFKGTNSAIDLTSKTGTKFILVNDKFVQTADGTLPANRCYLNFGSEELAGINTITIKTGVGPDDFIYLVDGSESNVGGSAVKSAISNGNITLTVTPNTEYFVEASDIKVTRSVSAVNGRAQAVDAPEAESGDVAVTAVNDSADPSGVTQYTFPADANSKYQVVINFHKRLSFADNKPSITFKSGNLVYNGQEQKPEIDNVTFKGQTLRSEDYEIVGYEDNIYPGGSDGKGSKIFIRGKRKYTGQNQGEFNISQRDLNNVAVAAIPDQIYTGVPIVPEITVTDIVNGIDILNRKEGYPDYKVTIGNNTNVGTATVSIDYPQIKINYTGNKSGITFKILPKDLSLEENKPTIAAIEDQAYDGTEKTPELVIEDGNHTLVLGTDYEVSYANNIDAGIATASITFKGNYTGTAEKTFGIVDPGYDRNVTVNFDSKNEWTTYYSAENLTLTNELKAYVVTGMNAKTVNVKEVNFIPRNVPILLNRVSGDKKEFAVKTCSGERLDVAIESQIDNELFKGTAEDMDITTVRGIKFVLINGEFKQVADGTLKPQRCYLVVPELPEGVTSLAINKASDAVIYLEEGSETTANIGTAVASQPANGIVTLTVSPKVGYYINGVEDITVVRNANAGKARAQKVDDGDVTVTAGSISDNADYSTTYRFTYPYETDCQYQLTVNFHKSVKLQTERPKVSVKAGTYVYDGTMKSPELSSVTLTDGTQLKPGTDFLVVGYEDNINAGTGKVKINGIRKYTDEYTGGEFSISQRDINLVKVKAIAEQTYTGAALKPSVEVTDIIKIGDADVDILNNVPGKPDYEVEYLENINVGEAKVNIIAKSVNYTGIKTGATFKIVPKDLSVEANKPTIAAIKDQIYTGSPIEPALDIKDGTTQLEAGKDYTVKYSNNVIEGEGTAKADITFIGNYKGTAQATFSIVFKEETKALNVSFGKDESWTTYYSPIDVKEVPGVKIFVVTGNKNKTGLDLITEEIKFIPRNVPLLLQHTDASVTTFTGTTMPSSTKLEGVTPDQDLFRGTASDLDLSTVDGVKFILQNDKFVQAIEGTLTANHCYVHLNAEEATDLNIVDDKMAEVIIEEEGKESPRSGTVTVSSSADADGYKTITVKPTEKLYATKDEITVLRYLAAGGAASRRAPGVDNTPVEVEALSAQADPSGETKYRFKYDSNYKYQIIVNFKSRVNLSDPKVSNPVVTLKAADIQNLEYDGQEKKPAVESVKCNGKVVDPANYTISYENNVDAGKPRVIITGKRFLMGATHAEFTIGKRDFSTVTVEPIGDQEYTGSPIEPAFVIKDMVGTQNLVKNTDYTVSYKNNIEVGTATISFLPKNNYKGSGKEYTFNIVPATAINMIPVDEQEGQWFSLTGQPLQNKPTQKGVYILRNKNKKTIKVRIK